MRTIEAMQRQLLGRLLDTSWHGAGFAPVKPLRQLIGKRGGNGSTQAQQHRPRVQQSADLLRLVRFGRVVYQQIRQPVKRRRKLQIAAMQHEIATTVE